MNDTSRDIVTVMCVGLLCLAVGAGSAWWVRGVSIERDTAVMQRAAQRTTDSLRLTIADQWSAVAAMQLRADRAESLFVADSAKHLSAVRSLLARLAHAETRANDTTDTNPAPVDPPTVGEISSAIRGCLLTVSQCGEARAAAEQVNDSLRRVARTLEARIRADSLQRDRDARAHAIALSRASGRSAWRDVKVAGWTGLALTAGCAVSHFGNPFGGK